MPTDRPLSLAVAGLAHGHVHWLLGREERGDLELIGIVESDGELVERYAREYDLDRSLVHGSLEDLLARHRPDAVVAFGSTLDHLRVVEAVAPHGIHVMVEKPLAVELEHARRMADLARRHGIRLLTNYETTWYGSTHDVAARVRAGELGPLRKLVFHHGHAGPARVGVDGAFLEWLTDPAQNGAGALFDFGCYGLNLMTWLTVGERPLAVTAVTQTFQPEAHPRVEDEATIVVEYERMQAIVQASWNWAIARKDMEVHGELGYACADDRARVRVRSTAAPDERLVTVPPRAAPLDDPFALLRALTAGEIDLEPFDPSSLENNLRVVELLCAARESARLGARVELGRGP